MTNGCAVSATLFAMMACSASDVAELETLPVRDAPQEAVPHSQAAPGDPFLGTAVAVEVAPL